MPPILKTNPIDGVSFLSKIVENLIGEYGHVHLDSTLSFMAEHHVYLSGYPFLDYDSTRKDWVCRWHVGKDQLVHTGRSPTLIRAVAEAIATRANYLFDLEKRQNA